MSESDSNISLAFVLTQDINIDTQAVLSAAEQMGMKMVALEHDKLGPLAFSVEGLGELYVMAVDAPHPDAAKMPNGPLSPNPEVVATGTCHLILTAMYLPGDNQTKDFHLAKLTAAVIRGSSAVAAMLFPGTVLYGAELFADIASQAQGLPIEICVDLTMAGEPNDRMSFVTHGLTRYGREEFYITCSRSGQGALDFVFMMVRWMINDPNKNLPTGDTIGRTAEERITVQRVPHPGGAEGEVVRLDVP